MEEKVKAPRFCVPLRLYRLVSPVRDQHLCLSQKLQTQSPLGVRCSRRRQGEKRGKKTDRETERQVSRVEAGAVSYFRLIMSS